MAQPDSSHTGFVLSAALAGANELISALGQDPLRIAEEAGIPPQALDDRELPLDGKSVGLFFHLAAKQCRCPNFGLALSSKQSWEILGPVWLLIRNSKTIGDALNKLVAYLSLYATSVVLTLDHSEPGWTALCYDTVSLDMLGEIHAIETGLAISVKEIGTHISPGWKPDSVQLRHHPPADVSEHIRNFGPGVMFNQDRNAIVFQSRLLDRPLKAGNAGDGAVLERAFHYHQPQNATGAHIRTENAIRNLLPHSNCSLDSIASIMGYASRTLQSHLSANGTSFQEISDHVRLQLAQKYLAHSTLTIGQISELLQFSETSAFTRFFKTHRQLTPRAYRKQSKMGL